jgi:hypothetical protein
MSLHRLFAWIIEKRHGSNQLYEDQQGVLLSRRLQELLDVTKPEPMDTASTPLEKQDDRGQKNRGHGT